MSSDIRLTAKLVSNHYWCPALAWLKIYGPDIAWSPPHFNREHAVLIDYDSIVESVLREAVEKLAQDCSVERIELEKKLYSPALKIIGSVDMFIQCNDKNLIVEAKIRRPRRNDPAFVQVGVYMILAEQNGYQNIIGYIASPDSLEKVDPRWRKIALEEIRKTRSTLRMKHPPQPRRPKNTCNTCIFKRICPYS